MEAGAGAAPASGGSGAGGTPSSGGSGAGGASGSSAGGASNAGAGGKDAATGGGGTGNGGTSGVPDASACAPCPSGICLEGGVCAECGADSDCHDATPRCNVTTNKCVACLPGATDNCADGLYCDGADFTCKTGCKTSASCGSGFCNAAHVCLDCDPNGTDSCTDGKFCTSTGSCAAGCKADGTGCASTVCLTTHECSSCVADSECAPGHVCASGQCLPSCGHDNDCPGGFTCCGDRCADLARDHRDCLACGTACASDQFCASDGCRGATLANVCDSAKATFLMDGLPIDDQQAPVLSAALVAGCTNKPTVRSTTQDSAGTINPKTGQPVVGSGDLQVVVGGPYGQLLIRYLDGAGETPIYTTGDTTGTQFRARNPDGGTGAPVVDAPASTLTDSHDFFLIETVADPSTGTLMLAIDGFLAPGTVAGIWYFSNVMLPALSTFTAGYYVYEWTDGDGDKQPSSGDTFKLITSGP